MKHITEEYGASCNLLVLTQEEFFESLEPFLKELGVRCRSTMMWSKNGERLMKIQAENPYKYWASGEQKRQADLDMSESSIRFYKR